MYFLVNITECLPYSFLFFRQFHTLLIILITLNGGYKEINIISYHFKDRSDPMEVCRKTILHLFYINKAFNDKCKD